MILVKSELAVPVQLGVVTAYVTVGATDDALWTRLQQEAETARTRGGLSEIAEHPQVAALRAAYRACGRDPQRYRGSAEALLRRVVQAKPLYQVNSVVDTNNLISLRTGMAVGSYDADRINGPVTFRTGTAQESYSAIGKGEFALDKLPVFADGDGPFGSPTSDSERTMVRLDTTSIVMILISFAGADLTSELETAAESLREFSAGHDVDVQIVG
jgi:DNA/RNA-binding domain of Phe-tRNA-synthetase-like protein